MSALIGWRDGSGIRSACCLFRGHQFSSLYPCQMAFICLKFQLQWPNAFFWLPWVILPCSTHKQRHIYRHLKMTTFRYPIFLFIFLYNCSRHFWEGGIEVFIFVEIYLSFSPILSAFALCIFKSLKFQMFALFCFLIIVNLLLIYSNFFVSYKILNLYSMLSGIFLFLLFLLRYIFFFTPLLFSSLLFCPLPWYPWSQFTEAILSFSAFHVD